MTWGKMRKRVTEQIFNLIDNYTNDLNDIYITLHSLGTMQAYLDSPNLIHDISSLEKEGQTVCLDLNLTGSLDSNVIATISAKAYSEGYIGVVKWFDVNPENTKEVAEFYKSKPLLNVFIVIKKMTQDLYQKDKERYSYIPKGSKSFSIGQHDERVFCDAGCGQEYTNSDEKGGFILGSKAYCPTCAKDNLPTIIKYGEKSYIKAWCPEGKSFKDFVLNIRRGNNH